MKSTLVLAGLAIAALVACSDDNTNTARTYNLTLDKASEVPVCAAAGANATASAVIVVAADNSSITATVTYSGLSGPPTLSHLHAGTPSIAGPVVLPITVALTSPYSQVLTATDYVAAAGAPATFADFVTSLRQGNQSYVNIHTDACRPGELRANIN
jgi:CHRD domain